MQSEARTTLMGFVSPPPQQPEALEKIAPRKLSEEIEGLIAAFGEGPVTLRGMMAVLRGRAYILAVFLLALPFCTPIPLPGLSTPRSEERRGGEEC